MKRALRAEEAHAEALRALAHLTRLRVFFHLVRAGGEAPVGVIQAALGIPAPTLSHHLDRLCRANLLRRRREQRFIFYSVRREMVGDLVRLLTACC